ncbi:MAG TPA: nicotinate-nucleotide adenylyltransferase [Acidimicrobiales bacterium]|nr:nicotinate-nucleotide adenylyltransferase [Acidimicrobiales bacterium]
MPGPEPPTRIGIMGGTFDPPHVGHVAAARAVLEQLSLTRLLLVVANDPWQKSGTRAVSPAEDRLALTEAVAAEVPGAEASRIEIDRGGPSYSVDTAEQILAEQGGGQAVTLYLVVGADLVPELETWHRHEDLRRLVTLAVVSRPTDVAPTIPAGWQVEWVGGPQVPVSSSEVRERLARGESVEGLVPEGVIHCIERRGMYAVT